MWMRIPVDCCHSGVCEMSHERREFSSRSDSLAKEIKIRTVDLIREEVVSVKASGCWEKRSDFQSRTRACIAL